MLKNKLKSIYLKLAAATVLVVAPLAIAGTSHADGSIDWTGHGVTNGSLDTVQCDEQNTPYIHWVFTTGGNDSVTAATLNLGGSGSGSFTMTQNGSGSWSKDTDFFNLSTLTASVNYTGDLGNGTANLNISHGCPGTGGEGGGPTDVCVNIEGVQTQVPSGMVVDNKGNCTTPSNNTTTTQVLGATTGGQGAAQVAVVPQGSVNGGGGAASSTVSKVSAVGLVGSLLSAGAGLALLNRRQG